MTRQDAIIELKWRKSKLRKLIDKEEWEAINMAIDALQDNALAHVPHVTLRDLLELTYTVTLISADVRRDDLRLVKSYLIGEGQNIENATYHQCKEVAEGRLVMIDRRINDHGKEVRGVSEMGWGTDFKAIPADLLDMKVNHFSQSSRYGGKSGTMLVVHLIEGEHQEVMDI